MPDVPKNAKKPEDHQPKSEPKPEVIKVTVRGFDLTVPAEALDDFELMDDLYVLEQEEDPTRLPVILRRLIGDRYREVIVSLRGDNGRVSIADGSEFVGEVMEAINPNS